MKSLLTTTAVAALSIGLMACVWKAKAEECPVGWNGSAVVATCTDPQNGTDGSNGKNGANGQNFSADEVMALSAALSSPAWLGDSENFSISGGLGFSDSATAIGATGILRLNKSLSAFGGAALSTSGDEWAGRVGLRAGW